MFIDPLFLLPDAVASIAVNTSRNSALFCGVSHPPSRICDVSMLDPSDWKRHVCSVATGPSRHSPTAGSRLCLTRCPPSGIRFRAPGKSPSTSNSPFPGTRFGSIQFQVPREPAPGLPTGGESDCDTQLFGGQILGISLATIEPYACLKDLTWSLRRAIVLYDPFALYSSRRPSAYLSTNNVPLQRYGHALHLRL